VRGRAAAVVAGAGLYALALPPTDLAPLAWLALVPLLLAVRGRPAREAFGWGLLYGCAFGWTVTWWAAQAAAGYFGLGLPLSVVALSVFYLLVSVPTFGVFAAGSAVLLRSGHPLARRLGVPALWVATELVRARIVGQPWGLLGYTQHAHLGLLQVAAVTGVYGISFLLALGNAALVEAMGRGQLRPAVAVLASVATMVGGIWGLGALHVRQDGAGEAAARVAVVQTNASPAYEWTRAYAAAHLASHVHATQALPATPDLALVVWPEYAVTQYVESEPAVAAQIGTLAARYHADVLFGAPRHEAGRTYNSVRLITARGRNGGHYDKQHLVLVAERRLFGSPAAAAPSESPREFSAGVEPGVLRSFVPVGTSICHEILYPELVGRAVRAGAALLVNVSNDGWLDGGYGVAGRQHFAMAVLRAVESGRYLVRAATTGESGIIDPYGRVLTAVAPGTAGLATAAVAGRSDLTPYVRFGDAFAAACALVALVALGHAATERRRALRLRWEHLAPLMS
jgi:apolipoprotein N-acyltransferase